MNSTNPSAPLSLLARVPRMTSGMYDGAIKARVAIRLPAMRHAVWLLATDTAHVAFNALRGGGSAESNMLRRAGVGPEHWNILRDLVLEACKQPVTARDIKAAVTDDSEKVGAVLNVLVATGEVLRIQAPNLHSNAYTFAATEAWLGKPLTPMLREDALTFLAGDYLQAYGPVTVDDFTWWTGLPRNRCEEALMSHEPIALDGGYLLWPGHVRPFEQSRPVANRVNLLPAWDPYPMGYEDRSRLGGPEILEAALDRNGNSLPVVLVEGKIGGLWDFSLDRGQNCTLTIRLFDEGGSRLWEAIEAEAGVVAYMLQARSLNLLRARIASPARAAANLEKGVLPAGGAKKARKAAKRRPAKKAVGRSLAPKKSPPGKRTTAKAGKRMTAKAKAAKRPAPRSPGKKVSPAKAPKATVARKARKARPQAAPPRRAKPAPVKRRK